MDSFYQHNPPSFHPNQNIKFMFCTACPAGAFYQIVEREKTTA